MQAFLLKLVQWILQALATVTVRYVKDHYTAWQERKLQRQQDEATKQPYDQAVQHGTKEEIRRATEDRLNS